eukprot:CFRG3832T1
MSSACNDVMKVYKNKQTLTRHLANEQVINEARDTDMSLNQNHLLGVDVGTTSVKVAVYTTSGIAVDSMSVRYGTHIERHEGWVEQDPSGWVQMIKEMFLRLGPTCWSTIAGVGVTSQVNTHVFVNSLGNPLIPAIVWQDQRCAAAAEQLNSMIPDDVRESCWGPNFRADASFLPSRALWVKDNMPDIWAQTRYILSPKAYCVMQLTGNVADDAMTSNRLVDKNGKYMQEAVDLIEGLSARLPTLLPMDAIVGAVKSEFLPNANTHDTYGVTVGTMDAFASMYGSGVSHPVNQTSVRTGCTHMNKITDNHVGEDNSVHTDAADAELTTANPKLTENDTVAFHIAGTSEVLGVVEEWPIACNAGVVFQGENVGEIVGVDMNVGNGHVQNKSRRGDLVAKGMENENICERANNKSFKIEGIVTFPPVADSGFVLHAGPTQMGCAAVDWFVKLMGYEDMGGIEHVFGQAASVCMGVSKCQDKIVGVGPNVGVGEYGCGTTNRVENTRTNDDTNNNPKKTTTANANATNDNDNTLKRVRRSPPLLFLPHLMGERAPVWDSCATGAFIGLTRAHTQAHMSLAVLEGVAFAAKFVLERLNAAAPNSTSPSTKVPSTTTSMELNGIKSVRMSGGGAKSDLWCQIKANVLGCTVERVLNVDSGTFGAALIAGVGVNLYSGMSEATKAVKVDKTFTPDPVVRKYYDDLFDLYKSSYYSLKSVNQGLKLCRET